MGEPRDNEREQDSRTASQRSDIDHRILARPGKDRRRQRGNGERDLGGDSQSAKNAESHAQTSTRTVLENEQRQRPREQHADRNENRLRPNQPCGLRERSQQYQACLNRDSR